MPRVYCHMRADGTIHRDVEGTECRDLSAAKAYARDIAIEIMHNSDRKTSLWSMCVEDEQGCFLFDLFFSDIASDFDGLSPDRQILAAETCRRISELIDVECAVRQTKRETRILLARAQGRPQLVYAKGK